MTTFTQVHKLIWANKTFRLLFFAAGIMICFLYFGMMQEKIMRGCFGGEILGGKCVNGEKYIYELTLVGILCLVYAVVSGIIILIKKSDNVCQTHSARWYAIAAFAYVSAMVCGNKALRYIDYPTQVISKCAKPIPVMLIGILLAHKRYVYQKYFFVLMIVIGVAAFAYKDGKVNENEAGYFIGFVLIGLSLLSDGVLGAVEDRMRATTNPSAMSFMFSISLYSSVFLAIVSVATGEIFGFYQFATKYTNIYIMIGSSALVGCLGQIFIYLMISEFGALPCSIVTTTRKFFTVLISVVFMPGNSLSVRQLVATVVVFAALFADAFWGKKKKLPMEESSEEESASDIEKNEPMHGNGLKISKN